MILEKVLKRLIVPFSQNNDSFSIPLLYNISPSPPKKTSLCFYSPWDYARVLANTPYFGYDDKNKYVN